jgi:hypothetical protein
MSYRRFEMYQIRQAIQRLRKQESARQVASALKLGITTVNTIRMTALAQGWLNQSESVPEDARWTALNPYNVATRCKARP